MGRKKNSSSKQKYVTLRKRWWGVEGEAESLKSLRIWKTRSTPIAIRIKPGDPLSLFSFNTVLEELNNTNHKELSKRNNIGKETKMHL